MEPFRYKGYVIEPSSYKLRAGGWVPRVFVVTDTRSEFRSRQFYSKTQTRPTEAAANAYAAEMGKLWVDKNG